MYINELAYTFSAIYNVRHNFSKLSPAHFALDSPSLTRGPDEVIIRLIGQSVPAIQCKADFQEPNVNV